MRQARQEKGPLIAVVGPCASGKSQLARALRERGYNAREVLQEHSYAPAMWQRITRPEVLIYLDVSEDVARQRRPTDAPEGWWDTLAQRLRHARQHADLYVDTDGLTIQQIVEQASAFLDDVLAPYE
jgi:chloramphenicol 3-O-phosphotransferase